MALNLILGPFKRQLRIETFIFNQFLLNAGFFLPQIVLIDFYRLFQPAPN